MMWGSFPFLDSLLYIVLDEILAHWGPFLYISLTLGILETRILAIVTLMVICVISIFYLMAFNSALPGVSVMKSSSF